MSISKTVLRNCLRDQRDMIMDATIVERDFEFEENGCYVFVGVRHAGKSYLLYQRMKQLLAHGYDWSNLLYVNFDDERLTEFSTEDFNTLLEVHYEDYGKKPIVFLDEVQRIEKWEMFTRRLANEKYIVYITGSNAKMLSKDVATTLGGRFFIIDVYPYSFKEFIKANQLELGEGWAFSTIERSSVVRLYKEYLRYGGMPELLEYRQKRERLSSLYQKIYLGDICARYNIQNDRALRILIKKLAESVKQPLSYNRMHNVVVSTGCKISLPTIIDYVNHTEDSWLIIPVRNELSSLSEKEGNRKYYFIDNGLLNLFLTDSETSLLENLVGMQLCRHYGKNEIGYFKAENEIDFVVPDSQIAIQVCFNLTDEQTRNREIPSLIRFIKKHPDWRGVIVTNDESEVIKEAGVRVEAIPAWKWLLQCN